MIKKISIVFFFLLLTACASKTIPLQPGDRFYNAVLRVHKPYVVSPTFWTLGFNFPATDYKAYMKDNQGIYFSSPTPIIGIDNIVGSVYRTGGFYYKASQNQIFFYLLDTSLFGGAYISRKPLLDLSYQLIN